MITNSSNYTVMYARVSLCVKSKTSSSTCNKQKKPATSYIDGCSRKRTVFSAAINRACVVNVSVIHQMKTARIKTEC